ncbi:hypothetical protein ZWY2020_009845 [Hordeum vulgare]|nr:hypothetical protein ZWY2020_009845 [Hordeum vulgare]
MESALSSSRSSHTGARESSPTTTKDMSGDNDADARVGDKVGSAVFVRQGCSGPNGVLQAGVGVVVFLFFLDGDQASRLLRHAKPSRSRPPSPLSATQRRRHAALAPTPSPTRCLP